MRARGQLAHNHFYTANHTAQSACTPHPETDVTAKATDAAACLTADAAACSTADAAAFLAANAPAYSAANTATHLTANTVTFTATARHTSTDPNNKPPIIPRPNHCPYLPQPHAIIPMDPPSVASADTTFGSLISTLPQTLVDGSYSKLNTPSNSCQRPAEMTVDRMTSSQHSAFS